MRSQPPGDVFEGLVGADRFIPVVGARAVDKHERRKRSLSFGNRQRSRQLPVAAADHHVFFQKEIGIGVFGRLVLGRWNGRDKLKAGDLFILVEHHSGIHADFLEFARHQGDGIGPQLLAPGCRLLFKSAEHARDLFPKFRQFIRARNPHHRLVKIPDRRLKVILVQVLQELPGFEDELVLGRSVLHPCPGRGQS